MWDLSHLSAGGSKPETLQGCGWQIPHLKDSSFVSWMLLLGNIIRLPLRLLPFILLGLVILLLLFPLPLVYLLILLLSLLLPLCFFDSFSFPFPSSSTSSSSSSSSSYSSSSFQLSKFMPAAEQAPGCWSPCEPGLTSIATWSHKPYQRETVAKVDPECGQWRPDFK